MSRLTVTNLHHNQHKRKPKINSLLLVLGTLSIVVIYHVLLSFDKTNHYLYPLLLSHDLNEQINMRLLAKRWLRRDDQEPHQTTPFPQPPPDEKCSCWNPKAKAPCCERFFRRAHKMGYMLTERLFHTRNLIGKVSTTQAFRRSPAEHDYRDVVLVRNFYESIASGYLYHKQGNECWLDHFGRRIVRRDKWTNDNFQKFAGGEKAYIKYKLDPAPYPGDTLCHYLANNTELVGMRAYMSWILNNGYEGVLASYVLNMFDPFNRTRYICYEDLSDPERDLQIVDQCLDFWFPTGHDAWDGRKPAKSKEYKGTHATSHDGVLRTRLRNLIQELDVKYFDGVVAWADSIFPCR